MTASGLRWRALLPLTLVAALLTIGACGDDDAVPAGDGDDPGVEEVGENEQNGARSAFLSACKRVVRSTPGLSDAKREELLVQCRGAAAGDEETLRRVARTVCDAIAFATTPAPLRGAAAQACRRAIPGGL